MYQKRGWDVTRGMSVRAVEAYQQGKFPLSKLTAKNLERAGITISVSFAKFLARRGVWRRCEWHHSSSYFHETDFYDLDDLNYLLEDDPERIAVLRAEHDAKRTLKQHPPEGVRVVGEYAIWGGTRTHPKLLRWQAFEGVRVGGWIKLPDGSKKKAGGNWVKFREVPEDSQ